MTQKRYEHKYSVRSERLVNLFVHDHREKYLDILHKLRLSKKRHTASCLDKHLN